MKKIYAERLEQGWKREISDLFRVLDRQPVSPHNCGKLDNYYSSDLKVRLKDIYRDQLLFGSWSNYCHKNNDH